MSRSENPVISPIKISVVLPIYNEAGTITDVILAIVNKLDTSAVQYEVIAVDDGSTDDTLTRLSSLRDKYPDRIRVVHHIVNRGNGAALRSGTRVANGSIVVYMDGDGQHRPDEILLLVEKIPPYDLVIGARTEDYQGPWHRGIANKFFNRFASWLSRTQIEDLTSGFRAMRRDAVLHFLHLFPNGFSSPTTTTLVFLKAGYNIEFVPIHVGKRLAGESKISPWSDGVQFSMIILRMIMLYDPLRIFFPAGMGLGLLGSISAIAGIWKAQRLFLPNSATLLFLSCILTWLLGLIAGQVANTMVHYHGDETIIVNGAPSDFTSLE